VIPTDSSTLDPGTRLGPYEVTGFLGAGGMGHVYKARDTRLGRAVAVKVLPRELSLERARLARFEQEARAASALNHPNIVTIYEVGESEAGPYLAMELIEGESFRDVIIHGPLPVRRAIDVASQVAEGLAKAHAAGIVHRDLKPENLMVSRDGFVKILDFGLAKLAAPDFQNLAQARTATVPGVRSGFGAAGTLAYMSPEQARGDPLDFRSDQFSFGLVLYEMVTGSHAFRRETDVETLAAIIREEPRPIDPGRTDLPVMLRWVIERCLAKDREERYASTQDLARDLRVLRERSSEGAHEGERDVQPTRRRFLRALSAAIAGALVLAGLFYLVGSRAEKGPPHSFQKVTSGNGAVWSARFASDGQTVVYGAAWDGSPVQLFETRIGATESRHMGLPSADVFAISPSGEMALSMAPRFFLTYQQVGTLARASLSGGAARELSPEIHGADWDPQGKILAIAHSVAGKDRLEFPAGKVLYETNWIIHSLRISPRGDSIAFMEFRDGTQSVKVVGLSDAPGEARTLSAGWQVSSRGLAWRVSGDEIWFSGTRGGPGLSLYAVSLAGKERLVLRLPGGVRLHDLDRSGRVLFSQGNGHLGLVTSSGEGHDKELPGAEISFLNDLSPDGRTVIYSGLLGAGGPGGPIYLRKLDGSAPVLLGEGYSGASLSPDGRWLLAKQLAGSSGLFLLPTGAGEVRQIANGPIRANAPAGWLDGGRQILFVGQEPGHGQRLYVQNLSDEKIRPLTEEGVFRGMASSDGRSVVTQVGRHGEGEIRIYAIDGGAPRVVPSRRDPTINRLSGWSADSRFLYFYRVGDVPTQVYRMDVATGELQPWRTIAPPDPAGVLRIHPIQVTPDGTAYAYCYMREKSNLYVYEGLK
jgi:eukaryotic-like serine/threonine-protein kinase